MGTFLLYTLAFLNSGILLIFHISDGLISNWQIAINLGLHGGRIGGIFITGIFGNFYTKRGGGIFDFQNGNSRWPCLRALLLERRGGTPDCHEWPL